MSAPWPGVRRWLNAACASVWAKPVLFALLLWPAADLVWAAATDQLGANPAEALIRRTGMLSLQTLCLALAVTPLRVMFRMPALARWRRMLGLFVFFYASLHALGYAWLDQGLILAAVAADVLQRPFVSVGALAWVVLALLAASSWRGAVQALGAARWKALHRGVYAVAVLALLHFFWMRAGKNNFAEPMVYLGVLMALLLWRAWQAKYKAKNGSSPYE